jgi:hypothetical protein
MDDDAAVAVAWRCSECGLFNLVKVGDEQPPTACTNCKGGEIKVVRAINRHGHPTALTAAAPRPAASASQATPTGAAPPAAR